MTDNALLECLRLPSRVAKDAGYSIDWTDSDTVRQSISEMDRWTMLMVRCAIDLASFTISGATKEELRQAGITTDNLLQLSADLSSDA